MGSQPPPHKGSGAPSPIFGPFLLWPNGLMYQDATWYEGRPQPTGLCVRCGPSPLPKKEAEPGGGAPQFSAHVYCGQTPGWIEVALTWHGGMPWSSPHCARMEHSSPPEKGGGARGQSPPQFSVHLYCGQTAGCIKMPLGMEVGLIPGDFVLDGEPALSPKGGGAPLP